MVLGTAGNFGTISGVANFDSVSIANAAVQVNLGSAGSAVSVTGPANSSFTVSGSSLDVFTLGTATNGGDVFNGLTTGDKLTFHSDFVTTAWKGSAEALVGDVNADTEWFYNATTGVLTYYDLQATAVESVTVVGVTAFSIDTYSFVVAA